MSTEDIVKFVAASVALLGGAGKAMVPVIKAFQQWHVAVLKARKTAGIESRKTISQSTSSNVQPVVQAQIQAANSERRRDWWALFWALANILSIILSYTVLVTYFFARPSNPTTRDLAVMVLCGVLFVISSRNTSPRN